MALRYKDVGGNPSDFDENLLPIKKKGAKRRAPPTAAELPAMFAALKIKHPRFSNGRIAEIIAARPDGAAYGKSAEAIERAEREWRKKNRKI